MVKIMKKNNCVLFYYDLFIKFDILSLKLYIHGLLRKIKLIKINILKQRYSYALI